MSVRLDRLQRALFECFSGLADDVVWAHSNVPREQLGSSLIKLELVGGPSLWHCKNAAGELLLPADSVVVRVTAATVGVRNVIALNGYDYRRDTVALDTVTTIRDALLADIQAGEADALTVTTAGADGISLVAKSLGKLRRLNVLGELSYDAPVFSGDAVLERVGTCHHLVGVQTFSAGKELHNGAAAMAIAALEETQDHDRIEELARYGVAVLDRGDVVPLDGIAGGSWTTRSAFDLLVSALTVAVSPVEQAEAVNATIAIGSETIEVAASAP